MCESAGNHCQIAASGHRIDFGLAANRQSLKMTQPASAIATEDKSKQRCILTLPRIAKRISREAALQGLFCVREDRRCARKWSSRLLLSFIVSLSSFWVLCKSTVAQYDHSERTRKETRTCGNLNSCRSEDLLEISHQGLSSHPRSYAPGSPTMSRRDRMSRFVVACMRLAAADVQFACGYLSLVDTHTPDR